VAQYQVLYWKDIPAQVKAADDAGKRVSRTLPDRFQVMIDQIAMTEGLAGTEDYLNQWRWTGKRELAGSAEEVVDAIIQELEREFEGR
jgi:hypothetical protein